MKLANGAKLKIEGHEYAMQDWKRLSKYALWVACAEECNPYYAENSGSLTLWCPLDDTDPPRKGDLAKAGAASALVAGVLSAGHPVLVTCQAGLNRSALVAGLALRQLGMPGRAVIDNIRMERGQRALGNKAFERTVMKG